jgi:hypothetical protein
MKNFKNNSKLKILEKFKRLKIQECDEETVEISLKKYSFTASFHNYSFNNYSILPSEDIEDISEPLTLCTYYTD